MSEPKKLSEILPAVMVDIGQRIFLYRAMQKVIKSRANAGRNKAQGDRRQQRSRIPTKSRIRRKKQYGYKQAKICRIRAGPQLPELSSAKLDTSKLAR